MATGLCIRSLLAPIIALFGWRLRPRIPSSSSRTRCSSPSPQCRSTSSRGVSCRELVEPRRGGALRCDPVVDLHVARPHRERCRTSRPPRRSWRSSSRSSSASHVPRQLALIAAVVTRRCDAPAVRGAPPRLSRGRSCSSGPSTLGVLLSALEHFLGLWPTLRVHRSSRWHTRPCECSPRTRRRKGSFGGYAELVARVRPLAGRAGSPSTTSPRGSCICSSSRSWSRRSSLVEPASRRPRQGALAGGSFRRRVPHGERCDGARSQGRSRARRTGSLTAPRPLPLLRRAAVGRLLRRVARARHAEAECP